MGGESAQAQTPDAAPTASEDDAQQESTACGRGCCAPSVDISGLSSYMTAGDSGGFTVSADDLDRTRRYKVTLSVNSRASFNSSCSSLYLYMPAYMMHEFGHTAGLDHSLHVYDIMSFPMEHSVRGLTGNDVKAMKNLYNNNHHAAN